MFAADVSVDNCTLTDMQFDASGPSYAGTAIVTLNGANLSVTNCSFSQIGRNSLFYFGAGATGGVAGNNVFTGKGVGDHLDYGIELGGGAVAVCTNNTITDCRGEASSDGSTSAAMIITTFFGAGTTGTLTGNFLTSNTGAVAGGFDGADTSVITASDNDVSGNDTYSASNTSTTTVHDYSANWHGSNVGATIAAALSGTAGGVDYTPWLDVGTDTDGGTDRVAGHSPRPCILGDQTSRLDTGPGAHWRGDPHPTLWLRRQSQYSPPLPGARWRLSPDRRGSGLSQTIPVPTTDQLQALLTRIITRLLKMLTRHGALTEEDTEIPYLTSPDADPALAPLHAAACTYRIALGPRAGQKVLTWKDPSLRLANSEVPQSSGCVRAQGFSLHAETSCGPQQRQKLERLCRYITRPALGHKRLSRTRAGEVVLQLKTPYRDGNHPSRDAPPGIPPTPSRPHPTSSAPSHSLS